jgi:Conjugative transposon, TraM
VAGTGRFVRNAGKVTLSKHLHKSIIMESIKGQKNENDLRQRKALLILPVIIVPMLAMGFHTLGGGKGVEGVVKSPSGTGINTTLPDARFDGKKKVLTKLAFYEQADKDSVRLAQRRKNDPYYSRPAGGIALSGHPDERAQELLGKLDQLKGVLSRQEQGLSVSGVRKVGDLRVAAGDDEMGRAMEAHWRVGSVSGVGGAGEMGVGHVDPDLEKLNGIMDKILRIKYPDQERAQDTTAPAVEHRTACLVMAAPKEEGIGELPTVEEKMEKDTDAILGGGGFTELDDVPADPVAENTVEAIVAHDQTLVSGESLDMRLAQDAVVGGVLMPAGTQFAGKASLSGERLLVTVSSIRIGSSVVPVSLEVVGLDGMPGIREPGSINRDAAKESADEAAGSLGVTSFDGTIGGQAAAASVQAAKSLLSRKIRMVRVSVPAGYRVLLINKKSLNH